MNKATDDELFLLIRQSDATAFDELHRRYWQELFRLAYKKIGNQAEVDDLLQDMFLEIWVKREQIYFNNAVAKWLSNRLWFKIVMYFRKKGFTEKQREAFSRFVQDQQVPGVQDAFNLQETESRYTEIMDMINGCIDTMPSRMKEIYRLNKTSGHTTAQIAELLQISPKTVSKQLERATARLKKLRLEMQLSELELLFVLWLINC